MPKMHIFLTLLGFLISLVLFGLSVESSFGAGAPHPDHPSMMAGSDDMPTSQLKVVTLFAGMVIQSLMIIVFLLAFPKGFFQSNPKAQTTLLIGGSVYYALYILMVMTSWKYEEIESVEMISGFPVPSAILLFGLGFIPLYFITAFLLNFNKWLYTPEDEEKFNQLMAKRNR
jgi:hypothetical protein